MFKKFKDILYDFLYGKCYLVEYYNENNDIKFSFKKRAKNFKDILDAIEYKWVTKLNLNYYSIGIYELDNCKE